MTTKLLGFVLLFVLAISPAFGEKLELNFPKLGEVTAEVILPPSYQLAQDQTYPVIYILDGQQHGKHTATNSAFLASTDVMPEIIVVALNSINRGRFYTPVKDKAIPRPTGEAAVLLEFISNKLIPKVNKTYRTSGFDMLAGHSLGGVFAAYTLQTQPDTFDAYYLFSPAMWWADEALTKTVSALKSSSSPFVFLSIANEGEKMQLAFSNYKLALTTNGIKFKEEGFPNDDHMTIPLNAQIRAFQTQFQDWLLAFDDVVADPNVFSTHYKKLNAHYGTNLKGQEFDIGQATQHIITQLKDKNKAIIASDLHLKMFPNSQWAFKSKADALALNGSINEAIRFMEKAVKIAKKKQDSYLPEIEGALADLKDKL